MRRIVEMSDGTFRVQHKFLWWWRFDVMGDGLVELPLGFTSIAEARAHIDRCNPVDIVKVVEYL